MKKRITQTVLVTLFITVFAFSLFSQEETSGLTTSTSTIDWTNQLFTSNILLDMEKAGMEMPSGKSAAVNRMNTQLPALIKDPLLSIYVNSDQLLGDLVLDQTLTLEQLTQIIDSGKQTPAVFTGSSSKIKMQHSLSLLQIESLFIHHRVPYKNVKPIENISSRPYTGIIIDARGPLPVHGEFIQDTVYPCFFPEIWDEDMNLIYERNMGDPEKEKLQGIVEYDWSDDETRYQDRIGPDPLHISAREVYGRFRTDPVISRSDALKILTVPENLNLLKDGKVVILLDKNNLIHPVSAPVKDNSYYIAYREIKQHLYNDEAERPAIQNGTDGIKILYDLKFKADSPELLPEELPKMEKLAETLKTINEDNAFTILVEGHTADVKKPEGQMKLSIQRTQTIINELVSQGLDKSIFSYRGYGGTEPIATNDTPQGRAQNRRVIITVRPKATYIQRQ